MSTLQVRKTLTLDPELVEALGAETLSSGLASAGRGVIVRGFAER